KETSSRPSELSQAKASWRSRSRLGSSKWRTWPPEHGHLAAHLGLNVSLSLQQRVDEVIE
ncbi:MAG: hypothetical protein WBE94_23045, partial [Pseudolabrys sp.]